MRMMDAEAGLIGDNEYRVYGAEALLESLPRNNSGLAKYQRTAGSPEDKGQHLTNGFQRWRSSISAYDSVPLPAIKGKGAWAGHEYYVLQPGVAVKKLGADKFEISIWDEMHISPMQILAQCVDLADREGYRTFKLASWTVEEYHGSPTNHSARPYWGRLWFKNIVDVVLQQQHELTSLEPVFVVDEIRSHVGEKVAPLGY